MAKDVIARIILMFLLGLAIGGFIVLFLADRAKAEMTDQWGHQRYEAPRHRHVTKKRVRHTHKKHRRKRAPAVKAYVKRDIEDQVACKEMLTVIGDARPSRNTAQEDAEAVFMRATRVTCSPRLKPGASLGGFRMTGLHKLLPLADPS